MTARDKASTAPGTREIVAWLIGIVAVSAAFRLALLTQVDAPSVFNDELGYQKLAQSIGREGRLALFSNEGLSYSPLYSAVLAPLYALGASVPTAYELTKAVNAILMSLSTIPVYLIARFALPRRESVLAAVLSALAPLMLYTSFVMSENLAYPLALVAVGAMLSALREPSALRDALLLVAIGAATAARIQLVVLLPAALTAVVLAAALGREGGGIRRSIARECRRHWLLFGVAGVMVLGAAIAALSGLGGESIAGRYGKIGSSDLPSARRFLEQGLWHLAGLDLALGVVPFVGAAVAAYFFFRSDSRRRLLPFAAVAVSVTAWLLLEVAYDAAVYGYSSYELPRLHERYLIYAVPLFLVALLATVRLPESRALVRASLAAAVPAAILPATIPFHKVVNVSSVVDTFGLQPFARIHDDMLEPLPHAALAAVWAGAAFALAYGVVRKTSMRAVVVLVLIAFVLIAGPTWSRIHSGSQFARAVLPAHQDWVDRAQPGGDVVLVAGGGARGTASALETAFYNLSITRVYTICARTFDVDFGEERVSVDDAGRVLGPAGPVRAAYAVVPSTWDVHGDLLATNARGHQILFAPANGTLSVDAASRARVTCTRDDKEE